MGYNYNTNMRGIIVICRQICWHEISWYYETFNWNSTIDQWTNIRTCFVKYHSLKFLSILSGVTPALIPDGVNEKVRVAFCPFLNTQGAASQPGMVKLLTFTFLSGISVSKRGSSVCMTKLAMMENPNIAYTDKTE